MALYMWRGTGSAYWLPGTINVGSTGPTVAQINDTDTIDLTDAVTGLSGFEASQSFINVPILRSRTPAQIAGEETFSNPQLVLVDDNGEGTDPVATIRQQIIDELVPGVGGTVVFFLHTQDPQPTDRCYWLRADVASQTPALSLDATASTIAINLAAQHELRKGTLQATGS